MALARHGKLNIRTAYFLFAQEKGKEIEDYSRWFKVKFIDGHIDTLICVNLGVRACDFAVYQYYLHLSSSVLPSKY